MTRNLIDSEGVQASLAESRQKRVTEEVYHAVICKLQIVSELVVKSIKSGR